MVYDSSVHKGNGLFKLEKEPLEKKKTTLLNQQNYLLTRSRFYILGPVGGVKGQIGLKWSMRSM